MTSRALDAFQYTQYTPVRRSRRTDNTHVYGGPLPFRGAPQYTLSVLVHGHVY
jgi:hypothetical protein